MLRGDHLVGLTRLTERHLQRDLPTCFSTDAERWCIWLFGWLSVTEPDRHTRHRTGPLGTWDQIQYMHIAYLEFQMRDSARVNRVSVKTDLVKNACHEHYASTVKDTVQRTIQMCLNQFRTMSPAGSSTSPDDHYICLWAASFAWNTQSFHRLE